MQEKNIFKNKKVKRKKSKKIPRNGPAAVHVQQTPLRESPRAIIIVKVYANLAECPPSLQVAKRRVLSTQTFKRSAN